MNIPSVNPQLRKIEGGQTVDYVFIVRNDGGTDCNEDIVDIDVYIDEEWNQEETMKSMSIENARAWWNNLVHNGFERVRTP
tara:strand:- start:156 stop:398 length:243 start_codon:yes stop_codon:yes gene_type:complete